MISEVSWANSFSSWWKLEFSSDFLSVFQSAPLNDEACRAKYRMLDRIESKNLSILALLMHVVQIAGHQYHLLLSLKFFSWYGLSDTFTKTWTGGLSCVFVVSSLWAIVVDGSILFRCPGCSLIRIVFSTTPGSVSLVHGFTSDKMFPSCFRHLKQDLNRKLKFLSTCWTRARKWHQRRIVFSRPHVDGFSTNMVRT